MKVRFIKKGIRTAALELNKVYEVIQIKHGYYQILSELDERYYFPPNLFEIVEK